MLWLNRIVRIAIERVVAAPRFFASGGVRWHALWCGYDGMTCAVVVIFVFLRGRHRYCTLPETVARFWLFARVL